MAPHKPLLFRTHRCQIVHRTAEQFVRCALGRVEWVTGAGPFAVVAYCPSGGSNGDPVTTVTLHADLAAARTTIARLDRVGCGARCQHLHEIRRVPIDSDATMRHGDACDYCRSVDGLERCCDKHPGTTICRWCRPGRPDHHRAPEGPGRADWDARLPPYPDRTDTVEGWADYERLVEELSVAAVAVVACAVCGGVMSNFGFESHAACSAGRVLPGASPPALRPLRPLPTGGRRQWDGPVETATYEEPAAPLGPLPPVDVSLDPAKFWTDWRSAFGEVSDDSPPDPGTKGVQ